MKLITTTLAFAMAAQFAGAQAPEAKTAEQVYKNIPQLKGTPADQLPAAMQFIVGLARCGVRGTATCKAKFDADDKPAKKTAREMMAITRR